MNHLSLSGVWQATWTSGNHGTADDFLKPLADPQRYLAFTFPGSIHRNLEDAGIIDDPRLGLNSLKSRWVEEHYWILRRTFSVPEEALQQPAFLHFDVVDGVAKVALNGEVIGEHANAHYPADFNITGKLRPGPNEVSILLESGMFKAADLPGSDYSIAPETLLVKRHHLRQAQYQFGWDWNPRLVFFGMHGSMEVVWGAQPWLKQVTVQAEVSKDLEFARIRLRPLIWLNGDEPKEVALKAATLNGAHGQAVVLLKPGESEGEVTIEVPHPRLWWPRGHGRPFLYPLELTVFIDGVEVARWQGRTGLRRVEIDQPQHPEAGNFFHIKINNQDIFCKGANWVPPELSAHEVAPEKVAALVALAEAENMNTLRVWGGGVWANHTLLNLCDERGIIVWHDLLFACSKYPADRPDFLADVEKEVAWGAREFSPHPSLAVWCGNNEMEEALWNWNYKDFGRTAPDFVLFHHVIPALLARIDTTRPYWPSSPYSSPIVSPVSPTTGDQHPWGVTLRYDDINFWAYRTYIDRFPNEGGVLGCAPAASLQKFLSEKDLKPRSFAWEHHDNTVEFWHPQPGTSYRLVEHWLGRPVSEMDLQTYTRASGLLQAEALKEYILNYRRRWPSSGSAIYWMFNDSWPTVHGWGTFDYYLNRKLSFHPVRRAFSDVVVVVADEGDEVSVYVVNDSPESLTLTVETGHFDPTGQVHTHRPVPFDATPYTSQRAATFPRDPLRIYYAVLRDEAGRAIAQDRLLMRPFGQWNVHPADIKMDVIEKYGQRYARYQSDHWVWNAVLDPSCQCLVTDDVFDLLPGVPYVIPLKEGEDPRPVAFTGNDLLAH